MMLMLQPIRRITNINATLQRGVAGAQSLFFSNDYVENSGNVVDANLYLAPAGAAGSHVAGAGV